MTTPTTIAVRAAAAAHAAAGVSVHRGFA